MIASISILLIGFIILFWSANRLVGESVQIAKIYKVSPMVIGIILVGFMTALPECAISLLAALHGYGHLALGNALGSYMANASMVLGISMLVSGIKVHRMIIMPEFIVMLLSLVITWVVFLDGQFTPFNAYMLFLLFFAYSIYLYYATQSSATSTKALFKKQEQDTMPEVFETPGVSPWFILAKLVFHLVVMLTSVHFITESAVKIAHHFKLGEFFIGATVLAIGTSLPELAASIVAVRKGAHEIALGNIIGSNIINLWVVLPLAAIFDAIKIPPVLMHRDMPFFFLATILIALQLFKKKSIIHYNRWLGVVLVVLYLLYLYALTIPGWALWA